MAWWNQDTLQIEGTEADQRTTSGTGGTGWLEFESAPTPAVQLVRLLSLAVSKVARPPKVRSFQPELAEMFTVGWAVRPNTDFNVRWGR